MRYPEAKIVVCDTLNAKERLFDPSHNSVGFIFNFAQRPQVMHLTMARLAMQQAVFDFPQVRRSKMLVRSVVYIPSRFASAIGKIALHTFSITFNDLLTDPLPIVTLVIVAASSGPFVFIFVFHALSIQERIFFLSTHIPQNKNEGATNDNKSNSLTYRTPNTWVAQPSGYSTPKRELNHASLETCKHRKDTIANTSVWP